MTPHPLLMQLSSEHTCALSLNHSGFRPQAGLYTSSIRKERQVQPSHKGKDKPVSIRGGFAVWDQAELPVPIFTWEKPYRNGGYSSSHLSAIDVILS
jgi:hypothetical protein